MNSENGIVEREDREVVAQLLRDDEKAWTRVMARVKEILTKTQKYREMARKFNVDVSDICSQLFINLHQGGFQRLRTFKFDSSFKTFLWWELRTAFNTLVREEDDTVSLKNPDWIGEPQADYLPDPDEDEETSPAFPPAGANPRPAAAAALESSEALEAVQQAFSSLWREKPAQAMILLLRGELGMPSAKVAEFLDVNVNTIDQNLSRARKFLKSETAHEK